MPWNPELFTPRALPTVPASQLKAVMLEMREALPKLGLDDDMDMYCVAVHGYQHASGYEKAQLLFWRMDLGPRNDN